MAGSSKKQYSAAEKTKIALEAIKGELATAQISSKYGVHPTQITKFRRAHLLSEPHLPRCFCVYKEN